MCGQGGRVSVVQPRVADTRKRTAAKGTGAHTGPSALCSEGRFRIRAGPVLPPGDRLWVAPVWKGASSRAPSHRKPTNAGGVLTMTSPSHTRSSLDADCTVVLTWTAGPTDQRGPRIPAARCSLRIGPRPVPWVPRRGRSASNCGKASGVGRSDMAVADLMARMQERVRASSQEQTEGLWHVMGVEVLRG